MNAQQAGNLLNCFVACLRQQPARAEGLSGQSRRRQNYLINIPLSASVRAACVDRRILPNAKEATNNVRRRGPDGHRSRPPRLSAASLRRRLQPILRERSATYSWLPVLTEHCKCWVSLHHRLHSLEGVAWHEVEVGRRPTCVAEHL